MSIGIIGQGKMGEIRIEAAMACGKHRFHVTDGEDLGYHDWIFDTSNAKAIFICTPNKFNVVYTIRALEAGRHVFCEKPPALNVKELLEVKKALKKSGKKLMYGFNHRHHESVQHIKKLIDSGKFGKVLWMRGRYGKCVEEDFLTSWRADPKQSGGGILIDQGIHMLDLFLYLGGEFKEVMSTISNNYWKVKGIEDNAFVILKGNFEASLHSTMTQWRHLFSLEIFLEKGSLILNGLKTPSGAYGDEVLTIAKRGKKASWTKEETIVYKTDNSWYNETKYFFDCIEKDKEVEIGNIGDAIRLMKIIDKIYGRRN